jgi:hypothetical protein
MLVKLLSEKYKSKQKQTKKVFNNFGLGVLSYFNIIESLIGTLFVICLISIPLMVLYYDPEPDHDKGITFSNFPKTIMLGNFG